MNAPTKSNILQSYQVVLYDRALHPELFQLRGRHVTTHGDYELEVWIMPGSHVLRFEHGSLCACELVTAQEDGLPDGGVVSAFLCAGERDFEHRFEEAGVNYITTVQTETLAENLYVATFDEILAYAAEKNALSHLWSDDAGRCLSVTDVERYNKEIHIQAFHLVANGGVVLRTQTIFEHE